MYLGVILNDVKFQKVVNINANNEEVAKKKLDAYVKTLNEQHGSNGAYVGMFFNGSELETITRLFYR